jgi:peptidoglycan/LPS O-acetylase OafA/YrhL
MALLYQTARNELAPPRVSAAPLTRELSLYLDAARFIAALVVLLSHFSIMAVSGGVFWQIAVFREDAVIVFFVLSGFVIAHAVATRETGLASYVVNRAARLYSVALPVIAITFALDHFGMRLDPYYAGWSYSAGSGWQQIVASLSFTNEFWNLGLFPGSDGPYWSLGYEVPYYVAFGLARFARGPWRVVLPLAVLAAAGPSIAVLFPLWLLGGALYRRSARRLPEWAGWALFIGSILVWSAIETRALSGADWIHHAAILGIARDRIPADYVTGIAFGLNIVGFQAIAHRARAALECARSPIRFLAARSFTLYLLHLPVMKFLAVLMPWGVQATASRVTILAATLVVVFAAAQLFELRKEPWRRFFAGAFARCLNSAPNSPASLMPLNHAAARSFARD